MSDGFYYWYRSARHAVSADRVIDVLEANGVVLANPATGGVTAVTNGPDSWGEQVPIGRGELLASLSLGIAEEVNFQLWLNDETDVFTRFRSMGSTMTVVEFGLDGMTAAEKEEVISAVSQAVETDRKGTLGLVVDRRGTTEDADWDSLVTGAPVPLDDWPDLLGLPLDVAARHPQLAAAQGRVEPPLMIYARDLRGV